MSSLTGVSPAITREELRKFFLITAASEQPPQMFSRCIDAEWHRMLAEPGYDQFCLDTIGRSVGHVREPGHGVVAWVASYHDRFGTLPAVWFADEHGSVDQDAYGRYQVGRTTGQASPVVTAWDCTPTTGDGDDD
ncbi:MAG: hypothetical protein ABR608_04205 [Pseudonocardiaceae bacterium]